MNTLEALPTDTINQMERTLMTLDFNDAQEFLRGISIIFPQNPEIVMALSEAYENTIRFEIEKP
jgi:hypothetical protein